MSDTSEHGYLLLFRGTDWSKVLSAEEMQNVASQFMAWYKGLADQGKVAGGQPLDASGKIVSGKGGRSVTDGPFAESKEAIGGYFSLKVDTMEEAVAIAKNCPSLAYGSSVEVRPVLAECPMMAQARKERELAGAAA